MNKISSFIEHIQQRLFQKMVSDNLIYNTCWEDPRIDRQLLQLDSQSKVVMLTSAGCNALDYLLDDPQIVHCVDSNPAQNALLEFKKALIEQCDYHVLWEFFGDGKKAGAGFIYEQHLRKSLPTDAARFWDRNITYFTPSLSFSSFYFMGTSGKVAHLMYKYIHRKGLYSQVKRLLNARSLEEQRYYFEEVEPLLWNGFHKWLVRRQSTMTMLGVPSTQRRMIDERYEAGLLQFIRQSLRKVFTKIPINDNYFWRVYLTGSYTKNCCPNYLREQNFSVLNNRIGRVRTFNASLLDFLKQQPETYSHFVLLDHQDWLAETDSELLAEEWREILAHAKTGARILFRSAGNPFEFMPHFIREKVHFKHSLTADLHKTDRVGTYESTHLGIVQ